MEKTDREECVCMTIVVQWYNVDPEKYWGYPEELRVVASTHPRFVAGSRFDFGFHKIAVHEGYTVISLPNNPNQELKDSMT